MEREKDEILHERNKHIEIIKENADLTEKVNSLLAETKNFRTKLKCDEKRIKGNI